MTLRIVTVIAILAISPPAFAQPRTKVQAVDEKIGIRGYAALGSITLAAQDTFDAVADTHSRETFLGGAQVTNLWRGLFADLAVSQMTIDGQRTFITNGQVFHLGIPLQVKMRPIDVVGGWRLRFGRVSPYAGAGLTFLRYEENADFAPAGEDVNESKTGPMFLGGVDVQVWRFIHAGAELRYRRVHGILGNGGASAEFDEDDAGGVGMAVRISVGR
jgi:opacity protein-like surface antigen